MLQFKLSEVRPLAEHARNASRHRKTYSQQQSEEDAPAGLWLVHDEGVYLMSNGFPSLSKKTSKGSVVAYAKGCNPKRNPNYYSTSRLEVGGDDFVEFLPLDLVEKGIRSGCQTLCIQLEGESMLVEVRP